MALTLYTLGYARVGAMPILQGLAARGVGVVDIRFSPRSRRPEWSRKQLAAHFGDVYRHVPELGNCNYQSRDLPVVLAAPLVGLVSVCYDLRFVRDVCLLCACAEVSACHRLLVANLVQAACPCEVVHL